MILLAAGIFINGKSQDRLSDISWSDWRHAALILVISAVAVSALYAARLSDHHVASGIRAAHDCRAQAHPAVPPIYAISLTVFAYWLFSVILKAPLERGMLWF